MDAGARETEEMLLKLERRITREYKQANKEIIAKTQDYFRRFEVKDKIKRKLLADGEISKHDYDYWRTGQILIGERWKEMCTTLAQDLHNTNEIAKSTAYETMPDVYALNHNYATFEAEKGSGVDTSYTLYDRATVERLMKEDNNILPPPTPNSATARKLAENKDLRWNYRKVNSCITQGILQGESLDKVAKRLQTVTDMNRRAAIRNARTMTTQAQNAGRVDGYKRAESMGIDLEQQWLATLDGRTRHSHRAVDGEHVKIGEKFSNGCRYPADPEAPPEEVYNCRCTLIAYVKGYENDLSDISQRDTSHFGRMTYDEWKNAHAKTNSSFTSSKEDSNIKLPNILIGRAVGAKRASERVLDFETGEEYDLVDGTYIRNVEVFAGKGTKTEFRAARKFAEKYGGRPEDWQHVKGIGTVQLETETADAELHWSQCEGIGRKDMFVKRWLWK